MDDLKKFLGSQPLFKSFSPEKLDELINLCPPRSFAPQEVIIPYGQPGRFLAIVLEGQAEASITKKNGERVRLGLLEPGDILGEASLLTGEPTNAEVIALEHSRLFLISHEVFSSHIAVNPGSVRVMAKTITDRLRSRQQNEDEKSRIQEAWENRSDPYGLSLVTEKAQKILVINCGSSSLKFSFFDTSDASKNLEGMVERIGLQTSILSVSTAKEKLRKEMGEVGYEEALRAVVEFLTDKDIGVINDIQELSAVGHRVVHGGEKHGRPVVIDDAVVAEIESCSRLAPLHNPPNLMAIRECLRLMPGVPQVAVFDTGFHQKMPAHAFLYGIPYDYYRNDGIRRYGFHGISHKYVSLRAAAFLKRNFRELKIISCHLGNGASVCAIDHGLSMDTSMGLTPLEGLIMGTRCGDLDPAAVLHLQREKRLSPEDVDKILNRQSGLLALSGISSDMREIEAEANKGNERALTAVNAFCYRIRKYVGAYTAAIGGLDVLIFTGGIGEGSAWVRGLACQGLSSMGIRVETILNKTVSPVRGEVADISDEQSQVKVLVVPTDEGRMIARETVQALGYQAMTEAISKREEKKIPIEVSAHHVHLSKDVMDALFGPGSELTPRSDLSQPGQFACQETINLIGPKGRVERIRVLGPLRGKSQVEISMTEEFKLGVKAPIRASGDLAGSPGLTLEGPKGTCHIPEGVICSFRHIHMSPEDALALGIKDRDMVSVKIEGERTLVFGDVLVRVHPDFRLSMHIDTDEANAANIQTGKEGRLVGVQERR